MTDDQNRVVPFPQRPIAVSMSELEQRIFSTAQAIFDNPGALAASLRALADAAELASIDRLDLPYGLHLLLVAIMEARA
jgi:hypothetical protein